MSLHDRHGSFYMRKRAAWRAGVRSMYTHQASPLLPLNSSQRPRTERWGLARALMLTSLLVVRQEPFGRSVDVHTLGWRLSPRRCTSGVQQAHGV